MKIPRSFPTLSSQHALLLGAVSLAVGGGILLSAPSGAAAEAPLAVPAESVLNDAHGVHASISLSQTSVLVGGVREVLAEVTLRAEDKPGGSDPVAVSLAMDVSGSMDGQKMEQARAAALQFVEALRDDDEIAFLAYDHQVRTLQHLAPVRDVRGTLAQEIRALRVGGGTAIPPAVAAAFNELRGRHTAMGRVVLLSDGRDGTGMPLQALRSRVQHELKGGNTLSTLAIGVDYDEAYMAGLADTGRGNYDVVRTGAEVSSFLALELKEARTMMASNAVASLQLPPGWDFAAHGTEVTQGARGALLLPLGALAAGQTSRAVLTLRVPANAAGGQGSVHGALTWNNPHGERVEQALSTPTVVAVLDPAAAEKSRNLETYAQARSVVIAAEQYTAVADWREGKTAQAQAAVEKNVKELESLSKVTRSPVVAKQLDDYRAAQQQVQQLSPDSEGGRMWSLKSNVTTRGYMQKSSFGR